MAAGLRDCGLADEPPGAFSAQLESVGGVLTRQTAFLANRYGTIRAMSLRYQVEVVASTDTGWGADCSTPVTRDRG
jgi:hypothetical protein